MSIKKISDKRGQLVDTALQLFYQHGIHAIGINEVLAKSGIAKKTLYHHFVSKEALIQACVIERDKRFMDWFETQCSNTESSTIFIRQVFDALDDWINNRATTLGLFDGCFFVNTVSEYGDTENEIYHLCLQHKLAVKQFIEKQLSANISDPKQLAGITNLLMLLKEGVINCAYVMNDREAALKAKPLALSYLT
jgi:AcrR family transcriptional regulator